MHNPPGEEILRSSLRTSLPLAALQAAKLLCHLQLLLLQNKLSYANPSPCHLIQCQTSTNAAMLIKEVLPLVRGGGGTSENNF